LRGGKPASRSESIFRIFFFYCRHMLIRGMIRLSKVASGLCLVTRTARHSTCWQISYQWFESAIRLDRNEWVGLRKSLKMAGAATGIGIFTGCDTPKTGTTIASLQQCVRVARRDGFFEDGIQGENRP
jgi:hypothetical protein